MSRSTTISPKNPALSAFWRMGSRQRQRLRVVFPGVSSLTLNPRGSVATRRAPTLWEPARTAVGSDLGCNWNTPETYAIEAS